MIVVRPIQTTDAILTSSSAPEPDATFGEIAWTAGTHNLGDERVKVSTHRRYRVTADPSTTDDPEVGVLANPPTWVDVGPTNRWAMFDDVNGTQTLADDDLNIVITPAQLINAVAAFNVTGASSVTVTLTADSVDVYTKTILMRDNSAINGWYDYFFEPIIELTRFVLLDLPAYPNGVLSIDAEGGAIGFGTLVYGRQTTLGTTVYGTGWQGLDFSVKERDEFGNFNIVRRRTADLMDYDCFLPKNLFGFVKNQLKSLSAVPTVWIGNPTDINDGTAVFGYYRDVQINISSPSVIDMTIQVEGLT